jgi:hypothetical protein
MIASLRAGSMGVFLCGVDEGKCSLDGWDMAVYNMASFP